MNDLSPVACTNRSGRIAAVPLIVGLVVMLNLIAFAVQIFR
jgi:hypothetical protein